MDLARLEGLANLRQRFAPLRELDQIARLPHAEPRALARIVRQTPEAETDKMPAARHRAPAPRRAVLAPRRHPQPPPPAGPSFAEVSFSRRSARRAPAEIATSPAPPSPSPARP